MSIADKQNEIEEKVNILRHESVQAIKEEITRQCNANGWEFSSLYVTSVYPKGGHYWKDEIEDTGLPELIFWHEQVFVGRFPDCIYRDGEWLGI